MGVFYFFQRVIAGNIYKVAQFSFLQSYDAAVYALLLVLYNRIAVNAITQANFFMNWIKAIKEMVHSIFRKSLLQNPLLSFIIDWTE